MSLLESFFGGGIKFTKKEIEILDRCFNSISQYTEQNYDFERKVINFSLKKDNLVPGLYGHEMVYSHTNTNNHNDSFDIRCRKYRINNKNDLNHIKDCFEEMHDDKISVPNINKFPTNILQVGWHGLGFITILNYENSGLVTSDCENSIKNNSIKFLKNSHLGKNKNITFE